MERKHCADCGEANMTRQGQAVWGFGSVITHDLQSRIYCSECRARRGLEYKFDPRSWAEIEREQQKGAA